MSNHEIRRPKNEVAPRWRKVEDRHEVILTERNIAQFKHPHGNTLTNLLVLHGLDVTREFETWKDPRSGTVHHYGHRLPGFTSQILLNTSNRSAGWHMRRGKKMNNDFRTFSFRV